MSPGETVLTLWRTFGTRALWHRACFQTRKSLRRVRAAPSAVRASVASSPVPRGWPFAPDAERVRAATDRGAALERAGRVAGGEHQAYRWTWMPLPRSPRDWNTHPASGFRYAAVPWYRVPHFDARAGDIKDAWEPARFAWAYDLARGWMLTGEDRFARAFWDAFELFAEGCPPFVGVQWSCGQETAIRALAWLWAEGALADAPSSTRERLGLLRTAIAWSAERIADAFSYALSQRNNHAVSEAAALVAVGARLRGADPRAPQWLRLGGQRLERLVRQQIAPDGWYIQHSFNYARLALDQLVVAERALRFAGRGLTPEAVGRVRSAVRLLAANIDPATGDLPIHGANDGAYVLPLSTRPYRDYVPALTAAAATFREPLPEPLSADRESLAWLGGGAVERAPADGVPAVRTGESGWFNVVVPGARVFGRAASYRSRPGHIDPLHVDVWIAGRHVATDAGTYRYAAPPPWANGLAGPDVHNTLTLEGYPLARRGARFLWLSWPRAQLRSARRTADGARVEFENQSWRRLGITHARTCELVPAGLTVLDEVTAPAEREARVWVQWLLDAAPDEIAVLADSAVDVVETRGAEGAALGWVSEGYGARRPVTSVRIGGWLRDGRFRVVTGFGVCRQPHLLRAALGAGGPP